MANKELADWVKEQKKNGFSDQEIKNYLIQQRYNPKDINEAIYYSNPNQNIHISFKEIIRPNFYKLFFPILVLVIIIVSSSINLVFIPKMGEISCKSLTNSKNLVDVYFLQKEEIQKNNADTDYIIDLMKQQKQIDEEISSLKPSTDYANLLFLSNMYLVHSGLHNLNPFYPVACELKGESDLIKKCSFYMHEKDVKCIVDTIQSSEPTMNSIGGTTFELLLTKGPINLIYLSVNSVLLIINSYLFICLIALLFVWSKQKSLNFKKIFSSILLLLPLIIFFLYGAIYHLLFYPYVIAFSFLLFVEKEKTKKLILDILILLTVAVLILGVVYVNYSFNSHYGNPISPSELELTSANEFNVIYCENSNLLNQEDKQKKGIEEKYLNEEWRVCDNPNCNDMCYDDCMNPKRVIELRGDKPSCICVC